MSFKGPGIYNTTFISLKEDISSIMESIKRILMTRPGERVNNLNFGSKLRYYLFSTKQECQELPYSIKNDLEKFEPRISIDDVKLEFSDIYIAKVTIDFTVRSTGEEFSYDLNL